MPRSLPRLLFVITVGLLSAFGCQSQVNEPLTVDRINHVKRHLHELRPGISRNDMWNTLNPMIGPIKLEVIKDADSTTHATQSYDMGHDYILRLMFDPRDDNIFRRAEVVHRPKKPKP